LLCFIYSLVLDQGVLGFLQLVLVHFEYLVVFPILQLIFLVP
jgi:hypothetical protein